MQKIILLLAFSLLGLSLSAQSEAKYRKTALWIDMMEDANVNYFEAIKAFNAYFERHKMPRIEEEEMGKDGYAYPSLKSREEEARERQEEAEVEAANEGRIFLKKTYEGMNWMDMAMQVRKFKQWTKTEQSWVQPDGRILSEGERQAIVDKQQAELKEVEIKNKK